MQKPNNNGRTTVTWLKKSNFKHDFTTFLLVLMLKSNLPGEEEFAI